MSLGADGRTIYCDGAGCHATTSVPVALQPVRLPMREAARFAEGWLYILKRDTVLHYCPLCSKRQIESHYVERAVQ